MSMTNDLEHSSANTNRPTLPKRHVFSPPAETESSPSYGLTFPGRPMHALRSQHPSVQLQIGELVLHGFAPAERYRIAAAVEAELSRLIAENGPPSGWEHTRVISELHTPMFQTEWARGPREWGRRIAQALYEGSLT